MSTKKTETPAADTFTPPPVTFTLRALLEASAEEIAAKTVGCATCPVSMLCEAGEGGTGWTCPTCKATGVWVDTPEGTDLPRDVIGVDCGKHKFHMRKEAEQIVKCTLCCGSGAELLVISKGPTQHLVLTEHATVKPLERQKQLQGFYKHWQDFYAKQAGAEKASEEAAAEKSETTSEASKKTKKTKK